MKHDTTRIISLGLLVIVFLLGAVPVQAQNSPPVAVGGSYVLRPDLLLQTNLSLTFWPLQNDYDPDGDPLIFIRGYCGNPCNYVNNGDGSFTYTPPLVHRRTFSMFDYAMGDGQNIVMGRVTIAVIPVDRTPVVLNPTFTIAHDTPLTITKDQLANDLDGDNLILSVDIPARGAYISMGDHLSEISVQPWTGYIGTTHFRYIITGDPMSTDLWDGRIDGEVTITMTGPVTAAFPITSGRGDVNQDGNSLETRNISIWIGRGQTQESYMGLRFESTSLPPPGVIITDAYLEVYSPSAQWIRVAVNIAGEKTVDSVPFTFTTRPSTRTLTSAQVTNYTNVLWTGRSWVQYRGLAPIIQEIVDQPDWHYSYQFLSSSMSLILRGLNGAWARKFVASYESGAAYAPRLIITYTLP
ncbi:MAG: Ig-like domain-containing protein [Anaerolineae bacterium]